jgi:hypothetical protein
VHTRYLDGLLLVTPNGGLDEATRRLLPPESHRSWSTVDANQHVLVAYRCDGRVPLAIGRLCRHGSRAEITCIAAATGPAAGPIVVRELEALARASGISDLKTVFQLGSRAER